MCDKHVRSHNLRHYFGSCFFARLRKRLFSLHASNHTHARKKAISLDNDFEVPKRKKKKIRDFM